MDSTIVCLKLYSLLSVLKITGFFEITLSEISRDVSFCLIITAAEGKNGYNGSLETVANNQSINQSYRFFVITTATVGFSTCTLLRLASVKQKPREGDSDPPKWV